MKQLIAAACATKLAVSEAELQTLKRQVAEKQQKTGIIGSAAHGPYVRALFDLFRERVRDLHALGLKIAESRVSRYNAHRISALVDARVLTLLKRLSAEIATISQSPYSPEEPYLEDAYQPLRNAFELELRIIAEKKPSWLKRFSGWILGIFTALLVAVLFAYLKGCFSNVLK